MAVKGIPALQRSQKFELLRRAKALLLISDLNEYEIRRRLMQDFRKTFTEAKVLYTEFLNLLPAFEIQIKDLHITPALINTMLQYKLGFRDGLHIFLAQKMKVPLITNERRAEQWKKVYPKVYTLEEFWKELTS